MLGVIIGVSTVIAVFAIGKGAESAVDDQFAGLSAKSIIVFGGFGGGKGGPTASSKLNIEDVQVIREEAKLIGVATGVVQGNATISYDGTEGSFAVIGTDLNFLLYQI